MSGSTSKNADQDKPIATDDSESVKKLIYSFKPSIEINKVVTLISSDGESFEVEEDVALESQTIKHWLEDKCENYDGKFVIHNVDSKHLEILINYSEKHVLLRKPVGSSTGDDDDDDEEEEEKIKEWEKEFIYGFDLNDLPGLILAANYLNIQSLIDVATQRVADTIKGKTVDEIRETFNIENDFTPEEYEEVLKEHPWAFE
ncbi:hypothetical protein IFM89_034036 [Coptis chinensis]|uniref:SKP1-like protein n=1 Tax=Coptis chinensis TaxID=261450 RepID=A0A835IRK1_9MAGN|nr:hypothetical protein IFM89_034036 [Coptis chinensis]